VTKLLDGMQIDIDLEIPMADGVILRADLYRPAGESPVPVILSYGPYAKLLHYEDGAPFQWSRMTSEFPETTQGTTNKYQSWELVDPEKWVPDGYAVLRVDSRGAGRSPGRMDLLSPRETQDLYECIEWAGVQSWCNGKVGLNGISYYAMNQWQVAALQPPHLAAMIAWEGASDLYRELAYHGGIYSTFSDFWYEGRVTTRQHGVGARGQRSRLTGEWVAGPETLPDEVLNARRSDFAGQMRKHPLFDDFWAERVPDLSRIDVPLLSAGNWGGMGLHLRGNVEGFMRAASTQKWLEVHGLQHWTHFYTDYGVDLQKRFFGHFLLGIDTGWDLQPPVLLQVRHPGERFVPRAEQEWPLARTQWTPYYLDPTRDELRTEDPGVEISRGYQALGDGLTFMSAPFEHDMEITGPLTAKLFVSSDTQDADIFVVVRAFTADLREVTFHGANEPHTPLAHGWLRASRRRLDEERSLPYRPWHTHDVDEPLVPGEVYELDVEIWPTCIVLPAGHRLAVSIRGKDYRWAGAGQEALAATGQGATAGANFQGVGPFRHTHADNRPEDLFAGEVRLHWKVGATPHVVIPVIPA
jgi:predicted acyl esterase